MLLSKQQSVNNNDNSSGEKSFWKIWKNLYLRNIIFNIIDQPLIFKTRDNLCLGNRIRFENLISIDIMSSKKSMSTILMDKISYHAPLDITGNSISKLYQSSNNIEIIKKLYVGYPIQMDSIRVNLAGAPIECLKLYNEYHVNNGGIVGYSPNYKCGGVIDIIQDKEIVDGAIINMNFQILDFVREIHSSVNKFKQQFQQQEDQYDDNDTCFTSSSSSSSSSSSITSKIQPIPNKGYSEELLISNACKSNEPEKMLCWIENELQLNLQVLIKKYPTTNHYNLFMNVLDKLPNERIPLVYYSAGDGCTYEKPFHYVFPFKYDVDNLKCLVLDTIPKKNELLLKQFTIEELLEKYKAGYEHKYFPFFIDYFFKENQVDRIINYLRVSKTISTIGDQYKTLYNDMLIFFYVETIRNFNLKALEYVVESNISLHFLNKESVIESLSTIIEKDQVVTFIKKFIIHYDLACYIIKLLFIYYPLDTIEALLEIQEFKSKFQKELNSERSDTIYSLITKVSFDKIRLLLSFRNRKIDDLKIRKLNSNNNGSTINNNLHTQSSSTNNNNQYSNIMSKPNLDKVLLFNTICNNDSNGCLTNNCKRKLFQDLNISNDSFENTISIYKSIDFTFIIQSEKFKIQSFLFKDWILKFYGENEISNLNTILKTLNNINNCKLSKYTTTSSSSSVVTNSVSESNILEEPTTCANPTSPSSNLEPIILLNNYYILKKFTKSLIVSNSTHYSNDILIYLILNIIKLESKLPYSIVYSLLDKTRFQVIEFLFNNQYKEFVLNSCKNRIDIESGGVDVTGNNESNDNGSGENVVPSNSKQTTATTTKKEDTNKIINQLFTRFKYQYYYSTDKMVSTSDTLEKCQSLFLHFGSPMYLIKYLRQNHKEGLPLVQLDSIISNKIFEYTNIDQFLELSKYVSFKSNSINSNNNNNGNDDGVVANNNNVDENNNNNFDIIIDEVDENEFENNTSNNINNNNNNLMITEPLDNLNNNINNNYVENEELEYLSILTNSITYNRVDIISYLFESNLLDPFIIVNNIISTSNKLFIVEYLIKKFKDTMFQNPIEKKLNLVYLSLINSNSVGTFKIIESIYPDFNFVIGKSIINLLVQKDQNNEKLLYLFNRGLLLNLDYLNHKFKKVSGRRVSIVYPTEIQKTISSIIHQQAKRESDSLNLDKKKLKKRSKF